MKEWKLARSPFQKLLHEDRTFMTETYTVEIRHQGNTHMLTVADDQTVLAAAQEAGLDLPSSCNAGVCTTCAAQLLDGTVDQTEGMGISPELQQQGYALLCVSYPRSDLKIETEKEDMVYHLQFGQFQKQKK
jgi:ferredoxin